jgi:hypothetical protein
MSYFKHAQTAGTLPDIPAYPQEETLTTLSMFIKHFLGSLLDRAKCNTTRREGQEGV